MGSIPLPHLLTEDGPVRGDTIKRIDKVSDEELAEIVGSCTTMKQVLLRIGYSGTSQMKVLKSRMNTLGIHVNRRKFIREHETPDSDVYCKDSKYGGIRYRVLSDDFMPYCCSICGNSGEWLGHTISLQLDHIDGNCTNNEKENLRWLCPNCHSQTKTYGSKNRISSSRGYKISESGVCPICKKHFVKHSRGQVCCSNACSNKRRTKPVPFSKEELYSSLISMKNFEAVGRKYGKTGKGIRVWCKRYNLSCYSKDYKGD